MSLKYFYLDFDGLGSNWQDYVLKNHFPDFKSIEELNQHPDRAALIKGVYEREPRLFRNLPPIEKYGQLLSHLTNRCVNWMILTAAGSDHPCYHTAREDKLHHIRHNFGVSSDKVIVARTSENKILYSGVGKVLIDDFHRNCHEWESVGGQSILVEANNYDIDDLIKRVDDIIDNT